VILIDTSLWIAMYRDRTGRLSRIVQEQAQGVAPTFARVIAAEILQGCLDEDEWRLVAEYLAEQPYVEMTAETWIGGARIFFELRRAGITLRSTLDGCIAQIALEHEAELFHCDRDFEKIAMVRPLKHRRVDPGRA